VASASYLESGGDQYTYQEYGPYGGRRWPWGTSGLLPSPYQFQGQDLEWTTVGTYLYHMGARWYDPYTGLWTQPDTVVPDPTDPLSLNRYSFVEGNPLRSTDPSGHAGMGAWGAAIGAAIELAPEGYAAATAAATALSVAVGQQRQELAAFAGQAGDQINEAVQQVVGPEATIPGGVDPNDPVQQARQEQINQGLARLRNLANNPSVYAQYRLGAQAQLERALYYQDQGVLQGVEVTQGSSRFDITLTTANDIVEVKYWTADYAENNYRQLSNQLAKYEALGKNITLEMYQTQTDPLDAQSFADLLRRLADEGINLDPRSQLLPPLGS
jgi:RHS repeat-associated protein